jgi:hypothetical protein
LTAGPGVGHGWAALRGRFGERSVRETTRTSSDGGKCRSVVMNSHTGININGTAALNEDGTINVSLNGVLNPNDTPDPDDQAWSRAFALHGENLVCLVTGRWPFIDWFYRLFETEPVSNFGYRVSIAEMQRMYMKHLQIKLTNIAVSLHLDKNIKDHSKNLENLLKLYSMSTTRKDNTLHHQCLMITNGV